MTPNVMNLFAHDTIAGLLENMTLAENEHYHKKTEQHAGATCAWSHEETEIACISECEVRSFKGRVLVDSVEQVLSITAW